jgi:predicted CXXCH cytochrome family protein
MKRIVLVAAVLFATSAFAAATAPKDAKVLEAKQGNVTFKHDTHAKVACDKCHGPGEAKAIGKLGKDKAHALCVACHKAEAKGPTKCAECHKK